MLQCFPAYPTGHLQEKSLTKSLHTPPLTHGSGLQSSMSGNREDDDVGDGDNDDDNGDDDDDVDVDDDYDDDDDDNDEDYGDVDNENVHWNLGVSENGFCFYQITELNKNILLVSCRKCCFA